MVDLDVADHAFLGGRLVLREPRRGHRSGTDAVLLAAAAHLGPGQHLVDVGAGAGAAALSVLCRVADATATLIERDAQMAALARHNIRANGFEERAKVVEVDISDRRIRSEWAQHGDVVISNPPFYLAGTVRPSAEAQRVASHVLNGMGHGDWLRHVLHFVKPRGRAVLIHRPDALPTLMSCAQGQGAARVRTIHSRAGESATRVIMTIAKGRRSPFELLPPLFMHGDDGLFTSVAEDLHRGIEWLE